MENKQQDHALDIPAEANRDKHMNYLAAERGEQDTGDDEDAGEERKQKRDADSGNDSSNAMLQHEKLIDPGNEHSHDADKESGETDRSKHDADAGGDGTGTMGSKPE
jgi:hypothetical protein